MSSTRRRSFLFKKSIPVSIKTRCKIIKTTSDYSIPEDVVKLSLFLVGGGGGGSTAFPHKENIDGNEVVFYAIGGKGAKTFTTPEIEKTDVITNINITIGEGGASGKNGGNTTAVVGPETYTANGGTGGAKNSTTDPMKQGENGSDVCPFGAVEDTSTDNSLSINEDDLFGAEGAITDSKRSGVTGGGSGMTGQQDATFYGAGGGGTPLGFLARAGKGYQGVVVIKEWYAE